MNTGIIKRALEIVEEALDLPLDAQQRFVERACGDDADLRREVESMLVLDSGVSIEEPISPDAFAAIPVKSSSADRYELHDEIGRGGMGKVFRARDHQLDREVAVKVLRDGANLSSEMQGRFVVEAQIGARLQHPGIAPVYDLGRLPDGRPFFAMKLVAGETLGSLLAARNDPLENRTRLLAVFEQLCQTIAYAHSHGIIHRDIKPDNVMVGEFGEVQAMDWGLAKAMPDDDAQENESMDCDENGILHSPSWSSSSSRETRIGMVMGTPAYMPPEQAAGKRGKPTDVFSLGAILCEILTGAPPYTAESPAEVYDKSARADLQEAITSLSNCEADAELVELAKHCLEPDSEDRPADAGEIAQRFSSYLQTVQSRLREAEIATARAAATALEEKKRRRVTRTLMATALALVTVVLGGWVWLAEQRAKQAQDAADRQAKIVQQLNEVRTEAVRLQQIALDAPLDDLSAWEMARSSIAKADSLLSTGAGPPEQVEQIKTLAQDIVRNQAERKLLASIERAREKATQQFTEPGVLEPEYIVRRREHLEQIFREVQLHPTLAAPSDAIAFLESKGAGIREELIGGLDEWLIACDVDDDRKWIADVTNRVDINPWRKKWRQAVIDRDGEQLMSISNDPETMTQSARSAINHFYSVMSISPASHAVSVLEQIYPQYPGDFWLNFTLGRATNSNLDHTVALRYYSVALGIRQISSVFRWIGRKYHAERRFTDAIYHFERAVELNPQSGTGWEGLAGAYVRAGRAEEAREIYERVLKLRPVNLEIPTTYAQFLCDTGESDKAVEFLYGVQKPIGTTSRPQRLALVTLLIEEERYVDAVRAYQQLVEARADVAFTGVRVALAAINAANGEGLGSEGLSDLQRRELRMLAHKWLKHGLELWLARRPSAILVLGEIQRAKAHKQVASVREPKQLAQLPDDEQSMWRRFWFNVDEAERQLTYVDPRIDDLTNWIVLDPSSIKSKGGAAFKRLPDGSFLVTGANVASDVYSIDVNMNPARMAAIRLDVIRNERLPRNGPGRDGSGNFHLEEITLEIPDDRVEGGTRVIPFARAWATYSWESRPIKNAIDGNMESAWHVWGQLGQSHTAIFYLPEPLAPIATQNFTIRLAHGDAEGQNLAINLGRFRLSIQRAPTPGRNANQAGVESGESKK